MFRTSGCIPVLLSLILFACGREEVTVQNESGTVALSEASSTLTKGCDPIDAIDLPSISYCKTLSNGNVSKVDLKPSTFVQDPVSCELSSPDDGMRASMIEMGYAPCET